MKPSPDLEAVAADLVAARRDRRPIPPIRTRLGSGDIEAAYDELAAVMMFLARPQASAVAGALAPVVGGV